MRSANSFFAEILRRIAEKRNSIRRYRRVVLCLSAVFVFITTYALILPAITLDDQTADETPGIETETVQNAGGDEPMDASKDKAEGASVSEKKNSSSGTKKADSDASAEKKVKDSGKDDLITEKTELEYEGDGYRVIAECGPATKLPTDVKLKVRELGSDGKITGANGKEYRPEDLEKKAQEEFKDQGSDIRLFDISLTSKSSDADDNGTGGLDPAAPVKVRIEFAEGLDITEDSSVDIIGFDTGKEELKTVKLETKTKRTPKDGYTQVDEVSFKAEKSTVYGLMYDYAGNASDEEAGSDGDGDPNDEDQDSGQNGDADGNTDEYGDADANGDADGTGEMTGDDQYGDADSDEYDADGETLGRTVISADGDTYRITVTYGDDAGVPERAELFASEITDVSSVYDNYVSKTESALGWDEGAATYVRLFDIRIVGPDGSKVEVEAPVDVKIELDDMERGGGNTSEDFSVIHFSGSKEDPEQMDTESDGNAVSFSTDGFSAYAIVQGPSAVPLGWSRITNMQGLQDNLTKGVYIGTTGGFFMRDYTAQGSSDASTTGIVKTKPARDYPNEDEAAKYYFEPVEGTTNQFYIYCVDGDSSKLYVHNDGSKNLTLTGEDEKTAFTVIVDNNGRFRFYNGNRYWNMWNGANGNHIAAYDVAGDGGNYFYIWKYDENFEDPYGLDGDTYGLMFWQDGTKGKALMAESSNVNNLDALALTVMAKTGNSSRLYVPDDSDISMWTFRWTGEDDKYNLSTVVDGSTRYLSISRGKLQLVEVPDETCDIQVVPGAGTHAGEICLKAGGATLTYSGNIDTGFNTSGAVGSEWLRLVEESELTSDYFMTYSARKVSVSDESVTNGSRIIVYTRVWNDETKKYEFYAIDHDGSLIRCFESGDDIQWVGSRLNSNLWNFVEYFWEGTEDPNYYYELYNQYSEEYIAPQLTGDQVLQDGTIGINLNGRRNGAYYSTIIAWDDDHYSYAGLKADLDSGRVVACPVGEADDFYFAVMQDMPIDDELATVPTVDHTQHGITMKLVNFNNRANMSSFLGSDDQYKNGNTENGLLSTALGDDGYPTTKGSNSLADWFSGATEVNHLFVESTYSGTGYYEYDSTQNFAHYDSASNNFVVYQQIGTTDSKKDKFYSHGQFFPFNDIKPGVFSTQKNTTDAIGNNLPNSDPRKYEQLYHVQNSSSPDYYFGVEVEASFTQTPNGLDDWGHDIIYEFTGDDDFWLYVDGELIIDLGGIHDALPGSVNYRTGEVKVNGRTTNLRTLFEENYRGRNPDATDDEVSEYLSQYFEEGSTVFREYTTHTMKIFYLERGAGASNLHMRFNLASIKPGHVLLGKELDGVDKTESVMSEFPYQIIYKKEGDDTEYYLSNAVKADPTRTEDFVYYKDTVTPVKYRAAADIGGAAYNDVFYLKPGEVADISFPEGMTEYRIVECGINTDVFDLVRANGEALTGTPVERQGQVIDGREDYSIGYMTPADRQRVDYVNRVDEDALRTITFRKLLYEEDGVTPITSEPGATFDFRLYMATEFAELDVANMEIYHVKDPNGNYCRWDVATQSFAMIGDGITDYSQLTDEQKTQARFTTSMNGSVSKIPVGYTVEIRNVLAGTKYRVQERPWEVPDGYSFQKYIFYPDYQGDDPEGITITGDDPDAVAEAGVPGIDVQGAENNTVVAGEDPHVDVCNLKGHGLRINKVWSDADYMSQRDPAYFAVYTKGEGGALTLVGDPEDSEKSTVRAMPYGTNTLYWYWLRLPVQGVLFRDYVIREVRIEGSGWTADDDGVVTLAPGNTLVPLDEGDTVVIDGMQKGESEESGFTYSVSYEEGEISAGSNVRVDTVTNSRPGIILRKSKWDTSKPLADAVFDLEDDTDTLIGTFTSADDGLITVAFLREGAEYSLTETRAPAGYHGLEAPMKITLVPAEEEGQDATVEVSGVDSEYYEMTTDADTGVTTITVKDRPYQLTAVKKDYDKAKADDPTAPMAGVRFALHKVITVDGVTSVELNPLAGYENLVTDANGVIPRIDSTLPAGNYELRERATPSGYNPLAAYIRFSVSRTGEVTLGSHPDSVSLTKEPAEGDEDGTLEYVMTILNSKVKKVSFKKVDVTSGEPLQGAKFDLHKYEHNTIVTPPMQSGLVSGANGILAKNGQSAFDLPNGVYYLIEKEAPAGYELKKDPIVITVSDSGITYNDGTQMSTSGDGVSTETSGGATVYTLRINNSPGVELPFTGGPGTKWMYILGSIMTLLAALALITRRRMAAG